MKIIKIILAAIFLLSAVPFEGHCEDSHSDDTVQHCMVAGHTCCHQAVVPVFKACTFVTSSVTKFNATGKFSYVNPFRISPDRPPIVRA